MCTPQLPAALSQLHSVPDSDKNGQENYWTSHERISGTEAKLCGCSGVQMNPQSLCFIRMASAKKRSILRVVYTLQHSFEKAWSGGSQTSWPGAGEMWREEEKKECCCVYFSSKNLHNVSTGFFYISYQQCIPGDSFYTVLEIFLGPYNSYFLNTAMDIVNFHFMLFCFVYMLTRQREKQLNVT